MKDPYMDRGSLFPGAGEFGKAVFAERDLKFNVISWSTSDEGCEEDEEEDPQQAEPDRAFVIRAFGVDASGASVGLKIEGFPPYFYVKAPSDAGSLRLVEESLSRMGRRLVLDAKVLRKKDFWGFTNGAEFTFFRLTFKSHGAMRRMVARLRNLSRSSAPQSVFSVDSRFVNLLRSGKVNVYESNIDPLLRFLHVRNIDPAGWIHVPERDCRWVPQDVRETTCSREYVCRWTSVRKLDGECQGIAPLVMAAFDIECTSSHGDFPVAKKDYHRMAADLEQVWTRGVSSMGQYEAVETLIACMETALGCRGMESEAPDPWTRQMSRLHLKRPPTGDAVVTLVKLIKRCSGDVYDALRMGSKASSKAINVTTTSKASNVTTTSKASNVTTSSKATTQQRDDTAEEDDESESPSLALRVLNATLDEAWPLEGDPVIQVGTSFSVYGRPNIIKRVVMVLGSCRTNAENDEESGTTVLTFDDEKSMLLAWADLVRSMDPDVLLGYNVFGFDMAYMYQRACEIMGVESADDRFCGSLGRLLKTPAKFAVQRLSSSALGDNVLRYIDMQGRVTIDLMKVVQRDHKLDSYKLDAVATHFTGEAKHDVSPADIFRLHKGSAEDRRIIADYCLQDCDLCLILASKLEIVANNTGMANVCSVPLSFIFMRGQGVKIFSLVAKQCRQDGYLIPTLDKVNAATEEDDGYEGAIVLEPETGMYLDDPISVLDYNSLYPSSMISENLSHDSIVLDPRYDNLPGVTYVSVTYDNYDSDRKKIGETACRFAQPDGAQPPGAKPGGEGRPRAVLPRILQELLAARKATRRRMEQVCIELHDGRRLGPGWYDASAGQWTPGDGSPKEVVERSDVKGVAPAHGAFQLAVMDGLQQAYKVTANSLYGQMGARTSPLYLKHVAACTTAVGRAMILKAKSYIEDHCGGHVVYGDTDSIFVRFNNVHPDGSKKCGIDAVASSIAQGQAASVGIRPLLKPPHNLEYEKTFYPMVLLSKKRYVGLLYGDDATKEPKQKSMGIALKRRDYAPVVKSIYGGLIDILLKRQDVPAAVEYLKRRLLDLADGRFELEDLIISKTLRAFYKQPYQIAHWVLAKRMYERDPGSAPQVNDRIPYVFVETRQKDALMGERIEHVDHVRRTPSLRIDTKTYILNQIQKPCLQILAIALEQLPGYDPSSAASVHADAAGYESILLDKKGDAKKARERWQTLREREVARMLFEPVLALPVFRERDNRCSGQREITSFFGRRA
jgi:DNA polymerase delta subunit 1